MILLKNTELSISYAYKLDNYIRGLENHWILMGADIQRLTEVKMDQSFYTLLAVTYFIEWVYCGE